MDRKTVLVVDDSHDNRVLEAKDGREAVDKARVHRPELVLTDLFMPQVGGAEALAEIRADDSLADTRVIAITAYPEQARQQAPAFDGFLAKPCALSDVVAEVQRVIGPPSPPDADGDGTGG